MTVGGLIEQLRALDENLEVRTPGCDMCCSGESNRVDKEDGIGGEHVVIKLVPGWVMGVKGAL